MSSPTELHSVILLGNAVVQYKRGVQCNTVRRCICEVYVSSYNVTMYNGVVGYWIDTGDSVTMLYEMYMHVLMRKLIITSILDIHLWCTDSTQLYGESARRR